MSNVTEKTIPAEQLQELRERVEGLNALVTNMHAEHGDAFEFRLQSRFREFEAPSIYLTIRQIFAEYGLGR